MDPRRPSAPQLSSPMAPASDDLEPVTALFVTIAPRPALLRVVEMAVSGREVKRIALAPAWEDQEAWATLLREARTRVRGAQRP